LRVFDKGKTGLRDLWLVHERIVGLLAPEGAWMIDGRDTDVECAMAGDVRPILVHNAHTSARNAHQAIFVKG
jgi:hypothetical protein